MSKSTSGGGMSLGGVLLVIFIVLKLVGVITWSWWWVLSPMWIGAILFFAVLIIMGIASVIISRSKF